MFMVMCLSVSQRLVVKYGSGDSVLINDLFYLNEDYKIVYWRILRIDMFSWSIWLNEVLNRLMVFVK